MTYLGIALSVSAGVLLGGAGEATADAPRLGIMVDAGFPDGAQGAVVVRVSPRVRVHGGGGYNMVAPGVRGGVSVIPFHFGIRPAIVAEVGRYFDGDANPVMQTLLGDADFNHASLSRVGYDYAAGRVGLEVGSRRLQFYIHAGYSYIRTRVHDPNALLDGNGDSVAVRFDGPIGIRGLVPSVRLGFTLYLM